MFLLKLLQKRSIFRSTLNANGAFSAVALALHVLLVSMDTHVYVIFMKNGQRLENIISGSHNLRWSKNTTFEL